MLIYSAGLRVGELVEEMNKQELFEKNLVLITEFNRYVLEHPEVAKRIPNDAIVVILPEYNQKLAEENLKIAKARREKISRWCL